MKSSVLLVLAVIVLTTTATQLSAATAGLAGGIGWMQPRSVKESESLEKRGKTANTPYVGLSVTFELPHRLSIQARAEYLQSRFDQTPVAYTQGERGWLFSWTVDSILLSPEIGYSFAIGPERFTISAIPYLIVPLNVQDFQRPQEIDNPKTNFGLGGRLSVGLRPFLPLWMEFAYLRDLTEVYNLNDVEILREEFRLGVRLDH